MHSARSPCNRGLLGLFTKLHGSHQSGLSAGQIAGRPFPYGQEYLGHLKTSLLSYRRKVKASGEAQQHEASLALAKQLWTLRWSLLKKPSNVSVEEKQAIAALESEDEGVVHRFCSIIRQLVHLFDHAHREAQAQLRLQQLRNEIRAVDDAHLEKMLTFFDDHWEQALGCETHTTHIATSPHGGPTITTG